MGRTWKDWQSTWEASPNKSTTRSSSTKTAECTKLVSSMDNLLRLFQIPSFTTKHRLWPLHWSLRGSHEARVQVDFIDRCATLQSGWSTGFAFGSRRMTSAEHPQLQYRRDGWRGRFGSLNRTVATNTTNKVGIALLYYFGQTGGMHTMVQDGKSNFPMLICLKTISL